MVDRVGRRALICGIMAEKNYHAACLLPANGAAQAQTAPVRVCVIDLGTNSFHTIIIDAYANGRFEVIDRFKEMVRLGRGITKHRLTEKVQRRAIRALKRIRQLSEGWHVEEFMAFATSAIREAENGGDFILRVRDETGIRVRTISGDFEARLIYQGIRRAVEMPEPSLIVDIGGGSTEFVVCTSDEVFFRCSQKIGAARMTQQFVTTDPVSKKEFRKLRAFYRRVLRDVFKAARAHGVKQIIGSSGTMENLAQVYLNAHGEPNRTIYQQTFEPQAFRETTKRIMASSTAEREAMPGIDAKRVDQVVAGAMLADVLLKDLDVAKLRISPHALREGMVVHFIEQNYERLEQQAPYANVRLRSVYEVGNRFQWEERHAQHVTALALLLFDVCRPLHGLGPKERELFEYAALLHDVGYHISRSSHHKHSLYLIKNADFRGFLPEEIDVMANVARYHRGALPKEKHPAYDRLTKEQQRLVWKMAALLRLAEGLDRSHFQNVRTLHAELDGKTLTLTLETKSDAQLELWGVRRSTDLFEATYKGTVVAKAQARHAAPVAEAPPAVEA